VRCRGFDDVSRPTVCRLGLPLVTLLVTLLVLGSDAGGVATRARGFLFDFLSAARPRSYQDTRVSGHPVRVVEIDPASIAKFGAWPWPHGTLAGLIDAAGKRGASVIVLAGSIDQPDPASGRQFDCLVPPSEF